MIYAISGSQLSKAYDAGGGQITSAFDVSGEEKWRTGKPEYSIDNVVPYYQAKTLSVAEEVNALDEHWQSFVFITDAHYDSSKSRSDGNQLHSQSVGLYLLANTNARFLALGGDYAYYQWQKADYQGYVTPFLESDFVNSIYVCMGNHEIYGNNTESFLCIYNDFLANRAGLTGNLERIYYYFDDASSKTRFVFLNTSDDDRFRMSATQISWLQSAVRVPDSTWNVVVIGHVNLDDLGGITTLNEANAQDIITAINGSNGNIVGYFCGHQHIDAISDTGNFYQVTLICDKYETINYYDGISYTSRSKGTITDSAISVISFNISTRQVVVRRIGAGRNQVMSYTY